MPSTSCRDVQARTGGFAGPPCWVELVSSPRSHEEHLFNVRSCFRVFVAQAGCDTSVCPRFRVGAMSCRATAPRTWDDQGRGTDREQRTKDQGLAATLNRPRPLSAPDRRRNLEAFRPELVSRVRQVLGEQGHGRSRCTPPCQGSIDAIVARTRSINARHAATSSSIACLFSTKSAA